MEKWLSPLVLVGILATALYLLYSWNHKWSANLAISTQLRISIVGAALSIVTLVFGAAISATIGLPFGNIVFGFTGFFAGVGWLFFGNVFIAAIKKNKLK